MERPFGRDGASTPPYSSRYKLGAIDSPHRSSVRSISSFAGGSVSSFQDFPTTTHHPEGMASPHGTMAQSNSRAVISALKGLQDKIKKLELERSDAEANLNKLATESRHYKDILQREQSAREMSKGLLSRQNEEIQDELQSADARCKLLEKQLEYMRKMVQTAETERDSAIQRSTMLAQQTVQQTTEEIKTQLDKLSGLERDHMKLTASHSIAESKIKELEDKLREEALQRRFMQDKTAELQTVAETNRILMNMASPPPLPPKLKKKKKKSKPKRPRPAQSPVQPGSHYHLNMGNLPFVVGKSTGKSHAVGANVQQVLALMKSHNPALCNAVSRVQRQHSPSTPSSSGSETEAGLEELLVALQDEFGHMSFEHQELARQIQDTDDRHVREDLERELEHLVSRMEAKGEQIALVRRHKEKLQSRKPRKPQTTKPRRTSAVLSGTGGEVQVITTVKTMGRKSVGAGERGSGSSGNMKVLKGMKTLQSSLTKDDLHWD